MANYNILECLSNTPYVVSAETLTEGVTIGFYIGEDLFCGTVGQETTNPITPLSQSGETFTDCCECLSAVTDTLNFTFIKCNTLETINLEASNFCNEFGTPLSGRTYEIQYGSETPFCATFQGINPTGETNYFYVSGPYVECVNCLSDVPRSANTETELCVVCSGVTSVVIPPHAVYTDAQGIAVTQLNTVALGGPDGLNN